MVVRGTTICLYLPRHDGVIDDEGQAGAREAPHGNRGEAALVVLKSDARISDMIVRA